MRRRRNQIKVVVVGGDAADGDLQHRPSPSLSAGKFSSVWEVLAVRAPWLLLPANRGRLSALTRCTAARYGAGPERRR